MKDGMHRMGIVLGAFVINESSLLQSNKGDQRWDITFEIFKMRRQRSTTG
jgi:hypothetical protein